MVEFITFMFAAVIIWVIGLIGGWMLNSYVRECKLEEEAKEVC